MRRCGTPRQPRPSRSRRDRGRTRPTRSQRSRRRCGVRPRRLEALGLGTEIREVELQRVDAPTICEAGWRSISTRRPPPRSAADAERIHASTSAIQHSTPYEAKTRSKPPSTWLGRCWESASTKAASMPASAASPRARSTATGEKSRPVALAPRRANDSVSSPKWHCRCSTSSPSTSPTEARTSSSSRSVSEEPPAKKPATS